MNIFSFNFYSKHKTVFIAVTLLPVFLMVSQSEARRSGGAIEREADCLREKSCVEEYTKYKSLWLTCLDEQAGLSEKKRRKLSAKVEGMGIHGLKKQEILTFNSKRKECHGNFLKNLSSIQIKKEIDDKRSAPPPAPDLTEKK